MISILQFVMQPLPCRQEKIRTALEAERVEVTDAYGNGQHVSIDVVSAMFEGESSMKRQRMVYKVHNQYEAPCCDRRLVRDCAYIVCGWYGQTSCSWLQRNGAFAPIQVMFCRLYGTSSRAQYMRWTA